LLEALRLDRAANDPDELFRLTARYVDRLAAGDFDAVASICTTLREMVPTEPAVELALVYDAAARHDLPRERRALDHARRSCRMHMVNIWETRALDLLTPHE